MDFSLIHMHTHIHMHTQPYIHTKCHQTVNSRADMLVWFGSCCEFMLWQSKISENKILVSSVHHKICFSSCHAAVNIQVLLQTQGHGYRNTWNAHNCSLKWSSAPSICLQMLYKIERRMNRAWKWSRRWAVNGCSKYSNSCKTVWTRSQSLSSNNPTINWQIRHQILHKTQGNMRGNEIDDRLTKRGSGQRFIGPEPFLGVSRQSIRRKMKRWMPNQHLALWRGPCSTQRQAWELISGLDLATGARLLSFNRTQTRAVIGLLTGHNTLSRHLHVMGLSDKPTCRKCGTEEETSVHILCKCEALASLRHTHLGSSFLDPEDIRVLGVEAIWNFVTSTGPL